jgi:CheY-like chemotaxis protein
MAALKLLLVDDDHSILMLMEKLLADKSYEVYKASDGDDAIAYLEKMHFDVVISDMVMPRVDGITLCRRYHEQVPIIMISGALDDFVARKLSLYCHCMLEKKDLTDHLLPAITKARERFSFKQLDNKISSAS